MPEQSDAASDRSATALLVALLNWIYAHGGDPETVVARAYDQWEVAMLTARAAHLGLPTAPIPPPLADRPFSLLRALAAVLDESEAPHSDESSRLIEVFHEHGWPLPGPGTHSAFLRYQAGENVDPNVRDVP